MGVIAHRGPHIRGLEEGTGGRTTVTGPRGGGLRAFNGSIEDGLQQSLGAPKGTLRRSNGRLPISALLPPSHIPTDLNAETCTWLWALPPDSWWVCSILYGKF